MLCLYTDGLLRRYGPDLDTATLDLADRLARLQRSEESLPSLSKGLMTGGDGSPFLDDAALLLARPSALDPGSVASWEFPAEPDAVGAARNAATEKLTEWGLEGNAFVTELIVSELVTNAVRHAGGPIGLRLIRGERLYCEVTDPSNTQPRLRRARTTDEGAAVSSWWPSSAAAGAAGTGRAGRPSGRSRSWWRSSRSEAGGPDGPMPRPT